MRGAFICTTDKVIQKHDGKCRLCLEVVTQILIETGKPKRTGKSQTTVTREWFKAHYEPATQTFVQHKCGSAPLQAAA